MGNRNRFLLQGSGSAIQAAIFMVADVTSIWQQKAYDNGLHKHLFLNVPPEERSPSSNGDPTKAAAQKAHIDMFNAAIEKHTRAFATSNPGKTFMRVWFVSETLLGVTVLTFDAHKWFNTVLDDPSSYGFSNTTG